MELGQLGVPAWTSIDGSMLSADISGFTALSERLAGKGKAGAEEITLLINTCFTALIECVTPTASATCSPSSHVAGRDGRVKPARRVVLHRSRA